MKTPKRQVSKQSIQERANHKRHLRRTLDLSKSGFGWEPGAYIYNHLGVEIKLRFNQEMWEWTAKAHHLGIEITFAHQPPQDIQALLNDWITENTAKPTSPSAKLRQATPAVKQMAQRHNIPIGLADELMLERGF
ncbi:MAG: hypothetical protein GY743_23450 [Planctomycetaceae bacterium]|nr:hypothetical protein [Planctomycetaceae bacterium]